MKLPATLNNLKILNLTCMTFDLLEDLSCSLFLIRTSPNLEKLNIFVSDCEVYDESDSAMVFLMVQDCLDVSLDWLQDVKVKSISGSDTEMALIKLLMATRQT